jgi:hypothetical protein
VVGCRKRLSLFNRGSRCLHLVKRTPPEQPLRGLNNVSAASTEGTCGRRETIKKRLGAKGTEPFRYQIIRFVRMTDSFG